MATKKAVTRRNFVGTAGAAAVATLATAPLLAQTAGARRRYAIVGTGVRGVGMWGRGFEKKYGDVLEFVGLCDLNPLRVEVAKRAIGVACPTFTSLDEMLAKAKPDLLMVTTVDATHVDCIVKALERGIDVLTEKPMATDQKQIQTLLDAEKRTGRKIVVTFNYRYAPKHQKIKEVLLSGEIGKVTSVDFSWYLDVRHGADYFRRWHRLREKSGSLWVHKSTHHFDLVNWWLDADPVEVSAVGGLHNYGKKGPFRHTHCRPCPHKAQCPFYWDITKDPGLVSLYVDCEKADGYLRDGCVFKEDVDIPDTMNAVVTLLERRHHELRPQHLHALRGVSPRLQRHQGSPGGARLRAPGLDRARGDGDVRDEELRGAEEDRDPEGRGRSRRGRRRPARPDLPAYRGARPHAPAGVAGGCDVVPHRHRGPQEHGRGPAGQGLGAGPALRSPSALVHSRAR